MVQIFTIRTLSTEHSEAGHPGNRSESCRKWWYERQTWQQVIVLDGVTVIPAFTFFFCKNIEEKEDFDKNHRERNNQVITVIFHKCNLKKRKTYRR